MLALGVIVLAGPAAQAAQASAAAAGQVAQPDGSPLTYGPGAIAWTGSSAFVADIDSTGNLDYW